MANQKIKTVIVGASGYTGSDFLRLAHQHPNIEIEGLVAHTHAGRKVEDVFPHLLYADLPDLVEFKDIDWTNIDAAICGLPHGTAEEIIAKLEGHIKVIDMSADFRLHDAGTYAEWSGRQHENPKLLKNAAYGLSELNREAIKSSKLVACPGCYPTASLLALVPLLKEGVIDETRLILDAKSGVSGAGRALKQNTLFCEAGEGLSPYAIGGHRHTPEIEQELSIIAGKEVKVNFTPHLVPMSRGELITCHLTLNAGKTIADARTALAAQYDQETFVHLAPVGMIPATQHVRGSNSCLINVFEGRSKSDLIVISTIDNLVKGSSGQALQNFNIVFDLDETTGLAQLPLFP